jgi:hypothetical protein
MPVYNGENFISAALESVRAEGTDGLEVVVVDDGSTDRTLEVVRCFARHIPLRLIKPGRMGNWVAASNLGLREAKGEWVCFLHQDDLWLPGRYARLGRETGIVQGALIVHDAMFVDPDGRRLGPWTCPLSQAVVPSDEFLEHLLVQNFIAMPSPLFRRTAALDTGGMDEALWFTADWDLWLRLGALGPVSFVAETLSAFRIHPGSQTVSRARLQGECEQQLTTVLQRHLARWRVIGRRRARVERVAMASVAVNSALSSMARGETYRRGALFLQLLRLGPLGWRRYLRDSRIFQRIGSRLKVMRVTGTMHKQAEARVEGAEERG